MISRLLLNQRELISKVVHHITAREDPEVPIEDQEAETEEDIRNLDAVVLTERRGEAEVLEKTIEEIEVLEREEREETEDSLMKI